MAQILDGIRVIEMASWVFVPAAGAILADLGADVIKIEHPNYPDPCRGLVASNLPTNVPNIMLETANRGKRSAGIDVSTTRVTRCCADSSSPRTSSSQAC
jgi:crotonobetainyl-CoA:carnitine CoA-transferase CaiB-like acyl-CoA transferase